MSIPMGYGGIDRIYGNLSIDNADKILDLIDLYEYIVEALEEEKDEDGSFVISEIQKN